MWDDFTDWRNASEEAAIRIIEPNLHTVWSPKGGEPVIINLNGGEA